MVLVRVVAKLPKVAVETILYWLSDWRYLAIAYPILLECSPRSNSPGLWAGALKRSAKRWFEQFGNRWPLDANNINYIKLIKLVGSNPNIMLQQYFEILSVLKRPGPVSLHYYYGNLVSPSAGFTRYEHQQRRVRHVIFHPTESVVALLFYDGHCYSFGVYAYAGAALAKNSQLLYWHHGPLSRYYTVCTGAPVCVCQLHCHWMKLMWSPKGTKLCCLETHMTGITSNRQNKVVGYFFNFDLQTYRIQKIDCGDGKALFDDMFLVTGRGGPLINNMYLWASDDDFYYPHAWFGRTGFWLFHINLRFNRETQRIVMTRCPRITFNPAIQPNLFVYTDQSFRPRSRDRCDFSESSFISNSTVESFEIPVSHWLIKNVLFTCDECPEPGHAPHSILRRQAIPVTENAFSPTSAIIFKRHRIHDAAPLSTDPSFLLVVLSCDQNIYQPPSSLDRSKWNGENVMPIDTDENVAYDLGSQCKTPADECVWGEDLSNLYVRKNHQEYVYLGIVKGESCDDKFEQLAWGSITIVDSPAYLPWQLEIMGQSNNYVLLRECCNRKIKPPPSQPPHHDSILFASEPRCFFFSKVLNQCLEIAHPHFFPHPTRDLYLNFNFQPSTRNNEAHPIVVVKSRVRCHSRENYDDLESDRQMTSTTAQTLLNQCTHCKKKCYFYNNTFNKSIPCIINDIR